jgi:putative ABC transport system substrate-binding protein
LEYRSAEGRTDRLDALAVDLVQSRVDVIIVSGAWAALAAQRATKTIPIVLIGVSDPVRYGLVESLSRPGTNITGLSDSAGSQLSPKRLDLLKELTPSISRIAVIYRTQQKPFAEFFEPLVRAAARLGFTLLPAVVDRDEQLDAAFAKITSDRANALMVMPTPLTWARGDSIADFAAQKRLPAVYAFSETVAAGGLMSYGVDVGEMWFRGGEYVDRILRGTSPRDIPVGQPSKFELLINAKTARTLGLTIPPSLRLRADQVLE